MYLNKKMEHGWKGWFWDLFFQIWREELHPLVKVNIDSCTQISALNKNNLEFLFWLHWQVYYAQVCLLLIPGFILTIKILLKSVAKPQTEFNQKIFYAILLVPYLELPAYHKFWQSVDNSLKLWQTTNIWISID